MEVYDNTPEAFQYKIGERRGIRSLVYLYYRNRIYDFPTDKESLDHILSDIMNAVNYCYRRIEERGYVEDEMVEEFHNIAIVLRGYCEVKYGELWDTVFSDFHRELFRYALEQGVKYNKGLIVKLLTQSEFILALSIYIFQYQAYEYDSNLILNYNDISVDDKDINMLMFMTHLVCPGIKEKIKIDIMNLSAEDLIRGIGTEYFVGRKEEIYGRIKLLLEKIGNDKDRYDSVVRDILMLYIDNLIDIKPFEDLVKDHIVYRLLYCPESVDYVSIELNTFINIRSGRIVDNAIAFGGYTLFKRVRKEYEKNEDIKYVDAFDRILKVDSFRRRYNEEKEARN